VPNALAPIGVFDSGVGGLSVVRALRRALPHDDVLYLGDTARLPYGSKPLAMVRGFAAESAAYLVDQRVKAIVVACNSASAAALPALAETIPVPVWGVVEPGVAAALAARRGGAVGVLGTTATIESNAYQSRLGRAGVPNWGRACPLFVPIVEERLADTPIAALVAEHYLFDRPADLDTVILACTHYPALAPTLGRLLGERVQLVDSAETTAQVVASELRSAGLVAPGPGPGRVRHLVTGDTDVFRHTAAALDWLAGEVSPLPLSELARSRSGVRA
jgi:glutamate racemase